jgi:hypothetical protein
VVNVAASGDDSLGASAANRKPSEVIVGSCEDAFGMVNELPRRTGTASSGLADELLVAGGGDSTDVDDETDGEAVDVGD